MGSSTICHISICPKFRTLKNAPAPVALIPSLAWVEIHWESKFCWDRYPVKAAPTDTRKATTPVTQVRRRRPRHAAMKNLPHRWMTMKKKNASTLQRWSEFTKSPALDTCHQAGPFNASTHPVAMTSRSADTVSTPKT